MPIALPRVLLPLSPSSLEMSAAMDLLASNLPAADVLVQLDSDHGSTRSQLSWVKRLAGAARARRNWVVVRDRLDIALAARVDGVVLPADGFDVFTAHRLAGTSSFWVGVEAHSPDEAGAASRDGASFVVVGARFHTDAEKSSFAAAVKAAREGGRAAVYAGGPEAAACADQAKAVGAHGVVVEIEGADADTIATRCRSVSAQWSGSSR